MDRTSIRGYARAERLLYDFLREAGVDLPETTFDKCCENPKKALAELMHLVSVNHLMDAELNRNLADALNDVNSDEPGELSVEERGDYILDWFKSEGRLPDTVTVPEAAAETGLTLHAVRAAIETDPTKVVPGRIYGFKPKGRWLLDRQSYEEWKEWREHRS